MMPFVKHTQVLQDKISMQFLDILVLSLFIFFMIFIFVGYHKTKSQLRELEEEKKNDKN